MSRINTKIYAEYPIKYVPRVNRPAPIGDKRKEEGQAEQQYKPAENRKLNKPSGLDVIA